MLPSSHISPMLVQKTLASLNQAPYFLEQLNSQETPTTHRKTYSFGYNYFSMTDENFFFTHIPDYLTELCQACIDSFPKEYALGKGSDYQNVIVSFYEAGYQLEPHVDVDSDRFAEGRPVQFHFGENIIGVVLESDPTGKLYVVKSKNEALRFKAKKVFELDEKSGVNYLMRGVYRHKPYYHGVSKVSRSRISVTFRSVILNERLPHHIK